MKEVPLTKGFKTNVDDSDYVILSKFRWHLFTSKEGMKYAVRTSIPRPQRTIYMHREIIKPPKGMYIDHKDMNGLNNQRSNLRLCTNGENQMNKLTYKNNTSGLKGVSWNKNSRKWASRISVEGEQIHLGMFDDKSIAYKAYVEACKKYHKEFARI